MEKIDKLPTLFMGHPVQYIFLSKAVFTFAKKCVYKQC